MEVKQKTLNNTVCPEKETKMFFINIFYKTLAIFDKIWYTIF